jgi:hypothetical protein
LSKLVYEVQKRKAINCIHLKSSQDNQDILDTINLIDYFNSLDDDIVSQPENTTPEKEVMLKEAEDYTIKLLKDNWSALEALVAELILRRKIHYLNACKIMKLAMKKAQE